MLVAAVAAITILAVRLVRVVLEAVVLVVFYLALDSYLIQIQSTQSQLAVVVLALLVALGVEVLMVQMVLIHHLVHTQLLQ